MNVVRADSKLTDCGNKKWDARKILINIEEIWLKQVLKNKVLFYLNFGFKLKARSKWNGHKKKKKMEFFIKIICFQTVFIGGEKEKAVKAYNNFNTW